VRIVSHWCARPAADERRKFFPLDAAAPKPDQGGIDMRYAIAVALAATPAAVSAQSVAVPAAPPAPQAEASLPAANQEATQPAPVASVPNEVSAKADKFKRFNEMRLKGWITPYPRIDDTILQDVGGFRSALASVGIGFFGLAKNTMLYNFRGDHSNAVYNGRNLTNSVNIQAIHLTWDTGTIGIEGGQFLFALANAAQEVEVVNGPRVVRISNLGYYQKLAGGRIELKGGVFDNQQEYVGTSVGGSFAAGTLGPKASILVQLGLGYLAYGAPAFNVKLNGKGGYYTKFGVQRSLPPGAANTEVPYNSSGLRFNIPGAKALFIGEVGRNRPATADNKSSWFRAGGIYNLTEYRDYRDGGTKKNWAAYGAGDVQLTQIDKHAPARGVYVGATMQYAPPAQNVYTQYIEGRLYGVGLLNSRPRDMTSVVVTYNKVSSDYQRFSLPRSNIRDNQITGTVSYSFRVAPGIYVQPGTGFVINPTIAQKVPVNFNGYFSTALFF
jgi:porin